MPETPAMPLAQAEPSMDEFWTMDILQDPLGIDPPLTRPEVAMAADELYYIVDWDLLCTFMLFKELINEIKKVQNGIEGLKHFNFKQAFKEFFKKQHINYKRHSKTILGH